MTRTSLPPASSQLSVAEVRARAAAGDLVNARRLYQALLGRLGPVTDVLVTECMLFEAEGDLEAALASLRGALASTPGSIHANAQMARILMRLERPAEAEAAALATLALDPANLNALTALEFAYARTERAQERLDVIRRIALAPASVESAVWSAVAQLAEAGCWTVILEVLGERGVRLSRRKVCAQRAEALIELGRQREALACILAGYATGDVRTVDMIERLLERRALTVAARFIDQALEGQSGSAKARALTMSAARKVCDGTTLEDSPFEFADAVRALEILLPDRESLTRAVARSVGFLVKRAGVLLAEGDAAAATDYLIRAGRLAPTDRTILELLADASARAGRPERRLDTLLRIKRARADADSLLEAVEGAVEASRWGAVSELILQAQGRGLEDRPDGAHPASEMRLRLVQRLTDFLDKGDYQGALAMVAGLKPWMDIVDWPRGSIARLLGASKRELRSQRMSADPVAMTRICSLHHELDPQDVDVGRLLARMHLRYRRFKEAAEVLGEVTRIDPHLARDWVDLAVARHELGEPERRDACTARAMVISPTVVLPEPLDEFRARILAR